MWLLDKLLFTHELGDHRLGYGVFLRDTFDLSMYLSIP